MNFKKVFTTIAISSVLLTGCGLKNNDAIIIVNKDKITQQEFNTAMERLINKRHVDVNSPLYFALKDKVVNELVVRKLLEQEIEKRKIVLTEEERQDAIKKIIDRYGSKETFQVELRKNGISNEKFRQDVDNELKIKKLIDMLGSVEVSDAEVKDYYKNNPEKFQYPEKVKASHILISANPAEIKQFLLSDKENAKLSEAELNKKIQEEISKQKVEAEKVLAEVKKNPKDFEKIAREKSEDIASGQKGGDLGFFAYTDMVEPFSKAAFSLKPNKVSDLVQSEYGFHIIMVKDRAKAGTISFDKAKDDIKHYLALEKRVALLEKLITQLKNNAKIDFVKEEYKPKVHKLK